MERLAGMERRGRMGRRLASLKPGVRPCVMAALTTSLVEVGPQRMHAGHGVEPVALRTTLEVAMTGLMERLYSTLLLTVSRTKALARVLLDPVAMEKPVHRETRVRTARLHP